MTSTRDIGLDVEPPKSECSDNKCPFHGSLPVRGIVLDGIVVSQWDKTATVQREYKVKIRKYERYEKRKYKVHAHNPPCLAAKIGDKVKVAECRPISKTKKFVIIENEGR